MPQLLKNEASIGNETVTIKQLIQKLQEYPPDMMVAYTWEGQINPVILDEFIVEPNNKHLTGPTLLLDAET